MDRLSALDAEFLHLEDETSPMHIAGICTFEGPAPTLGELVDLVDARLPSLPRYRQRVRTVPLEIGRPIWVDDPGFHLDRHVHHAALPAPGGDAELHALMGRLMAHALDRSRPLWEAWLVDGLADGRWALVFKVHHCMVDGIAGVHLLEAFLDVDPEAPPGTPVPWRPAPEPSFAGKVVGSWLGLADDLVPWARRVAGTIASPLDTARSLGEFARGVGNVLPHLRPTRHLAIEGRIGAHRAWSHATFELADVAAIRRRFGGTVNDVILSSATAGYRALLLAHGDDPDTALVRTAIPVSMRDPDRRHEVGNRVSTLVAELPVAIDDPVERLASVIETTRALKESHIAETADVLMVVADLAPPMVVGALSRMSVGVEHRVAQRLVTTITTNVPGPQFPLYCRGRQMLEYLPYLGLTEGVRVSTAMLSYNGSIAIGVTGDEDSVPDVHVATEAISADFTALRRAARRRRATPAVGR